MVRSEAAAVRQLLHPVAMVVLRYHPLMKVFAERLKGDGPAPKAGIAACPHKQVRLALRSAQVTPRV
jgi:hypothetical protein